MAVSQLLTHGRNLGLVTFGIEELNLNSVARVAFLSQFILNPYIDFIQSLVGDILQHPNLNRAVALALLTQVPLIPNHTGQGKDN